MSQSNSQQFSDLPKGATVLSVPPPPSGNIVDYNPQQSTDTIPPPPSGSIVDYDPRDQAQAESVGPDGLSNEERTFLRHNPNYQYIKRDPKFPNRQQGIYPIFDKSSWRNDPSYEQHPVDLHLLRHTFEFGLGSAAATAGGTVIPAATGAIAEALPNVLPHTIEGVQALGEWAKAHPMAAYVAYSVIRDLLPGAKKAIGLVKAAPNLGD